MEIFKPTSADCETTAAISRLLKQLTTSDTNFSQQTLADIICSATSDIFLLRIEQTIIGMITLGNYLCPTGRKVWIEDVVIDTAYRGKGYGKLLVEHAITYTKELSPCTLMLTSNPTRIAANELYRASGFEPKITNVYKMSF